MSSVLGWFRSQSDDSACRFEQGLGLLAHRGTEQVDGVSSPSGILGVARYGWECDQSVAGPAQVVVSGDWVAVADAALADTFVERLH